MSNDWYLISSDMNDCRSFRVGVSRMWVSGRICEGDGRAVIEDDRVPRFIERMGSEGGKGVRVGRCVRGSCDGTRR